MRKHSRLIGAAGSMLLLATSVAPVFGASHREAPLISADAAADHTDVFAWVDGPVRTSSLSSDGQENRINLVVNVSPMQDPAGGPNFYLFDPKVKYDIKIDNNGDGLPDVTYTFRFTTHVRSNGTFLSNTGQVTSPSDGDLNVYQTYDLFKSEGGRTERLLDDAYTAPSNVGPRATPDYPKTAAAAVRSISGWREGLRRPARRSLLRRPWARSSTWAAFARSTASMRSRSIPPRASTICRATNVLTLALQVPTCAADQGGKVYAPDDARATIGVWAANYRQQNTMLGRDGTSRASGPWIQVSRMGNPLINEVIIPRGLKDKWNARAPRYDYVFERYYLKPELAGLINGLYPALPDARTTGRGDLSLILLNGLPGLNSTGARKMDVLRLNTGIPACTTDSADR